jgi:hypothetical protein
MFALRRLLGHSTSDPDHGRYSDGTSVRPILLHITRKSRRDGNRRLSVAECFAVAGFRVIRLSRIDVLSEFLMRRRPEAALVDWNFSPDIQAVIELRLSKRTPTAGIPVAFYNAPERGIRGPCALPYVRYLPARCTDNDILECITSLTTFIGRQGDLPKGIESSALEGEIHDNALTDLFQFIEQGSRSGSLIVEHAETSGIVHFYRGKISYATAAGLAGKEAVLALLGLGRGRFRYLADTRPSPTTGNCSLIIMETLVEWTKRFDEIPRH